MLVYICYVVEAGLYELFGLVDVVGDLAHILVIGEGYQLSVSESRLDVSVAEKLHYVQQVSCLVIFHRCSPVSQSLKVNLKNPGIS